MKQQFLKAIAGTIRMTAYDKNRPIVPTSGTVALYKNDGSTVIQAADTVVVNAVTGEMTYALTTAHTATLGLNYKASWTYLVSGLTYYETQLFDVVNSILSIPITDDDIFNELPSLRKTNFQATGTATAGASASITDTKSRTEADDHWKGGIVEILSGTGAGQVRDCTGNTQSSGVITVNPAWGTSPDSTSIYRVVKSFSSTIEQSFEKIEQMIYNKGKRDTLILESSQIRIPLIYLCVSSIARDLREEKDDRWDLIAMTYDDLFEKSFNSLALDYDEDESGGVQGQEAQTNATSIRVQRS